MDDAEIYEWSWPTGAAAQHVLARQWELERQVEGKVPVFLDTSFWIMAREAAFGKDENEKAISLLGALRLAAQSGRAFFPITADLIEEFSKQTPGFFKETMELVDRLSLGVALVPHYERLAIELEAFLARTFPQHPPERRPVWTRGAFAFGYEDLRPAAIDADDALLIELAEKAWQAAPSKVVATYPADLFNATRDSERLAEFLNAQERSHEVDGHAAALQSEVAGAASMITGIAAREYRRLAAAEGRQWEAEDIEGSRSFGRKLASIMVEALRKDENRSTFGSLYVPAALHAGVRSHTGRKIKANDLFDFRHASAALPYCQAFFTEGPLRNLINSGHMRLDRLYGCTVVCSVDKAISWLGELQKS